MKYILITPAYNEENYIENTIRSVITQSVLPIEWVIVSDGSTDKTNEIVMDYSIKHSFVKLYRHTNDDPEKTRLGRIARRVVSCINKGFEIIERKDYQFFGCLDADVSFNESYYESLMKKFDKNSRLGLGGGFIYNVSPEKKWPYFTKSNLVGGPVQFFRRECWEDIGGYIPGGHQDYFAVASCRMKGWKVQSFPDLEVYHHKHASAAGRSQIKAKYHLGCMDYVCGDTFLFSFLRSISNVNKKPFLIGSILRILGYLSTALRNEPKQVTPELGMFLKKEQRMRMQNGLLKVLGKKHE